MANLLTLKYVGHHGAVDVDPDGLGEVTVVFGGTIDVPKDKANNMLAQPANWTLATAATAATAKDKS